ncbi:2047_t:CDS:10, partial [Funneliformis caledonium]
NSGIHLALVIIGIALLFKVAAAPFHNWAPDVYDGVPTIVTTWLAIMPKVAILAFLVSALLSLVIGGLLGLAQYRIKRLLAYSTISHMGFILLALAIHTQEGIEAYLFYLVQYVLTSINIFFVLLAFGDHPYGSAWDTPSSAGFSLFDNAELPKNSPIRYISHISRNSNIQSNPALALTFAITLFSMAEPLVRAPINGAGTIRGIGQSAGNQTLDPQRLYVRTMGSPVVRYSPIQEGGDNKLRSWRSSFLKRNANVNTLLQFWQGAKNAEFNTLSLPMFNEFHALFYGPPGLRTKGPQSLGRGWAEGNGTKIVPLNLGAPYLTITRLLGEYNAYKLCLYINMLRKVSNMSPNRPRNGKGTPIILHFVVTALVVWGLCLYSTLGLTLTTAAKALAYLSPILKGKGRKDARFSCFPRSSTRASYLGQALSMGKTHFGLVFDTARGYPLCGPCAISTRPRGSTLESLYESSCKSRRDFSPEILESISGYFLVQYGIVGALPYTLERFDSRTGQTYTATHFATFGLPFFGALFHEWYTIVNGKATKRLPANIANLLTPVALAYWTASDGTYHKKTGAFNIQSTRVSNGSSKEQYCIRIAKASMVTFQALSGIQIFPLLAAFFLNGDGCKAQSGFYLSTIPLPL